MNYAVLVALRAWGESGIAGTKHNPVVLWFFKLSGHAWVKDDETPWCAAFVNWVLAQCNLIGTRSLSARSFLTFGKATNKPKFGCIVVLWRDSIDSPYGHVGFFIKETDDMIYILGGNQSNSVNIAPFPKARLLGYRTFGK